MTNTFTKLASAVSAFALLATIAPASVYAAGPVVDPIAPQTIAIGAVAAFTATATDIEGDLFTWSLAGPVPSGAVINSTSGDFTWDTTGAAAGVYTFDVVATDSSILSETGSVSATITVEEPTSAVVTSESELTAALANTNITSITFGSNFTVNSTVTVNRAVTINGAGKTLTAGAGVTGTGLLITASNVTVTDLTVDAGNLYIQAIQAYTVTGITLDGVTAKNAGKSGIMVNGSTVTVRDVTTSGNAWHGINVDQGSGVTSAAILTVEGTSAHTEAGPDIFIDDTATGSVVDSAGQYAQITSGPAIAYYLSTVSNETELTEALANPGITTIKLGTSFTVNAAVNVNRNVTIDGNGKTLSAGSASVRHAILVTGSNVTIKNLTVNGNDHLVHGIQAYTATNVVLESVTVKDNGKSGLLVNGSTVAVTDLTTTGNGWNGVNVDQGSGVTSPATLTVNGTSQHDETDAIWIDSIAKTNVSVVDTNNQYTSSERAWTNTSGANLVGRVYVLAQPENDNNGRSGRSGSSRRTVNTNSNVNANASVTGQVNSVTPGQGQVLGASTYNFTVDLWYGKTGADVNALQQMLIDAGLLAIPAPTGWFGPMTQAALKQWQATHGVPSTGYFGPLTRAAIAATMTAPTTGTTTPAN